LSTCPDRAHAHAHPLPPPPTTTGNLVNIDDSEMNTMCFHNFWMPGWKKLVEHGDRQVSQTPNDFTLVRDWLVSAEDLRRVLMTKPFWARGTPARLFSRTAERGLEVIEVILLCAPGWVVKLTLSRRTCCHRILNTPQEAGSGNSRISSSAINISTQFPPPHLQIVLIYIQILVSHKNDAIRFTSSHCMLPDHRSEWLSS
ncbi:hypothetical protein BGW80DRAFT_1322414, partial [Lactifluus volemus]